MNTYNFAASVAFASNTNVKLGEIQTVFYCTTYSTKSTQEDDKKSFKRVIDTFARCFLKRRLEIEASNEEEGETECLENDAREGFRNMNTGILANCQAHVISATLAHYIVRHGSRFRYSHDFSYIPVAQYEHYFRNMEIWTPLQFAKEGRFAIGSNIINYLQRPKDLEDECNICFFVNFKHAKLSKKLKDSGEYYSFLETHPSKDTLCIIDRDNSDYMFFWRSLFAFYLICQRSVLFFHSTINRSQLLSI
eukprot:scaffold130500_cov55-Attheya_sp.AAC.1